LVLGAAVKKLLLVGASFLLSAGSLAGDLPVKAPPKAAWMDSWAGPYIGVYFGAGAGRARESFTATSGSGRTDIVNNVVQDQTSEQTRSTGNLAGNMTGSMVDLFAGYNWRAGNFVVGGQVEGTVFSDVALKAIGTETFNRVRTLNGLIDSTFSRVETTENNQQLRSRVGLVGRAGYLVTPDVLLYGLGGLELGHFVYPDGNDRFGGSNGKWVAGYTVGGGGEVKLTDNWSLRGEYRYLHFNVNRNEASSSSATSVQGANTTAIVESEAAARRTSADFHLGKVGLVYRFGEARPLSAMAAMPAAAGTAWSDGWAGPYFGAYFGAGAGRARQAFTRTSSNSTFNSLGDTSLTATSSAGNLFGNMTGSMVDLFAGYNWRAGNFVVGGQLEGTVFSDVALKLTGTQTSNTVSTANGLITSTSSRVNTAEDNQQLRSRAGLVGRAGYLVTPDVLLYGLGGLELGHFVYPDSGDGRFGDAGGKNGKWVAGYTVGAGGEVKLTDNWSLRGEYRYLHFDVNRNAADSSSATTVDDATSTTVDSDASARRTSADFHLGKVGLVYRFGEARPLSAMAAMPAPGAAWSDGWAGPYFGAYFGAGAGRARQTFRSANESAGLNFLGNVTGGATSSAGNFAGDMTGSMVDLFAGYNWRAGNFVVGGQLEGTVFSDVALKLTGTQTSNSVSTANGLITSTSSHADTAEDEQQLRSRAGLVGRVGYLVTPDVLLYGLGGLELGHFVYPDSNDDFGDNGKWVAGYTVGAGGEVKLTDNWSLRGEYRYLHFDVNRNDASSSSGTVTGATTTASVSSDAAARRTSADFHLGKVGLVYRFGAGGLRSAMAAMPVKAAPRAALSDSWAGIYFGAYFASGAGRAKESVTRTTSSSRTETLNNVVQHQTFNQTSTIYDLAGNMKGSMVDLFAGYNWRAGNFVVGGQLEGSVFSDVALKPIGTYTSNEVSTVNGVLTSRSSAGTNDGDNQQLRSMVGLVGRAGYLVTPDLLLYGLGGLALGHFVYPDNTDQSGGKNGKWVAGYTVGAGGELKLTDRWSLRGEYRYLHFDVNRNDASSSSRTTVTGATTDSSANSAAAARQTNAAFHLGKIGLAYKF
jgi:opacity protein-like surface antigen